MATRDTVLAKILIDDQTKLGFNSYARNVERAKKTSESFRKNAIDKVQLGLENQKLALKNTAKELDLLTAANHGANDAQLEYIATLHKDIDALNQASAAKEEASRQTKLKADEEKRLQQLTERTIAQLKMEKDVTKMTSDELRLMKLEMQGLSKAQLAMVKSAQENTAATRGVETAAMRASKGGLRMMRGGLGQVGHQIQDIAVQLQMGQNALLIFGQQGSQLASLFGKNGALIGALLAVGAAVGTSLAPALFNSKKAIDELKKSSEETGKMLEVDFLSATAKVTEEFAKLSRESKELADNRLRIALVNAIEAANLAMKEFDSTASVFFKGFNPAAPEAMLDRLANKFDISTSEAEKLRGMFLKLGLGGEKAAAALSSYVNELASAKDPTDKKSAALIKLDNALLENIHAVKESVTIQKLLQDVLNGTQKEYKDTTKVVKELTEAKKSSFDAFKSSMNSYLLEQIAIQQGEDAALRYKLALDGLTSTQIDLMLKMHNKTNALREDKEKTDNSARAQDDFVTSLKRSTQEIGLNEDALTRLQGKRLGVDPKITEALIAERNARQANADATEKEANSAEELKASRENLVEGIVAQADAYGKSSIELAIHQASILGLGETAKKQFDEAIERIKRLREEEEKTKKDEAHKLKTETDFESLRKSLLSEEEALLESYERQNQIVDDYLLLNADKEREASEIKLQILADFQKKKEELLKKGVDGEILQGSKLTDSMLSQLGTQFAGVQASNKKMFAAQKAFRIANAIQTTYNAAGNALESPYPWPLPQVFAATAIAAGLANVAQIRSTSFDGGGFTGSGGRSGGVDGKGGFHAILHPQETVIDHTKGQGGGVTIVNNIDASGADANVDMKIRAAMQQTSQQTVASIQDLMRRRRFI